MLGVNRPISSGPGYSSVIAGHVGLAYGGRRPPPGSLGLCTCADAPATSVHGRQGVAHQAAVILGIEEG
jgi:hypothetical protein